MVNTWKPILAALVIFLAGVATGSFAIKLKPPQLPSRPGWTQGNRGGPGGPRGGHEGRSRDMTQRLAAELALDADQRAKVETLIKESQERVRLIADEVGPRFQSVFKRMNAEIRQLLTPEQQQKFDEMLTRLERRGRRGDRDGKPPRPDDGPSPPPNQPRLGPPPEDAGPPEPPPG